MITSFTPDLKGCLPESAWPRVLRALRQEPLVWKALLEETFHQGALEFAKGEAQFWSPACLSLLALGKPELINQIRGSTKPLLDKELTSQATAAYKAFTCVQSGEKSPLTFTQAGLIALAISQQMRSGRDQQNVLAQYSHIPADNWKPIFACLFGMLDQPEEWVVSCIQHQPEAYYPLLVHALLANPLELEQLASILHSALDDASPEKRLILLRLVNKQYPELARTVSNQLADKGEAQIGEKQGDLTQLQSLMQRAELYQLGGQHTQAIPLLDAAWELSRKMQAELAAQVAHSAVRNDDQQSAMQALARAAEINPDTEGTRSELALARMQTGSLEPHQLKFDTESIDTSSHPASLMAVAKLAQQSGDLEQARRLGCLALENALALPDQSELLEHTLPSLTELLLELHLPTEASRAAKKVIEHNPNDVSTLVNLSKAQLALNELEPALESAHITTALQPDKPAYRRNLAHILAANKQWDKAQNEIEELIKQQNNPSDDDQCLLAQYALDGDEPQKAAEACQQVLQRSPNHGLAHSLFGQALSRIGDQNSAVEHFHQAITLAPHLPAPWLALAEHHLALDEIEKARENLLTACQAVPDNAALRLALGKLYQREAQLEAALAEFMQASQLGDPDPVIEQQAAQHCGEAQLAMGKLEEAKQQLGQIYQQYPNNLALADLYSKTLLALGEIEPALTVLSLAMQAEEPPLEIYLDYGQAHLLLGAQPEEAQSAFKTVLSLDPEHPFAKVLLGEALALDGQHQAALQEYSSCLESADMLSPQWRSRLNASMAKSALALNQAAAAIAALEEALLEMPGDIEMHKTLTQAYHQADLKHDAADSLSAVYQAGMEDADTLLWVSDQALLQEQDELAGQALDQAVRLAPSNAEVLVRTGYLQIKRNDPVSARHTFSKLFTIKEINADQLRLAAQALIDLGDIPSSVPYLEKALEVGGCDPTNLLTDLAKVHLQSGNLLEALNVLERHIDLTPDDPQLYQSKTDVLLMLDRPEAALKCLQEAVQLAPDNASLLHGLAQLQRENHELESALSNIGKAFILTPNDPKVRALALEINFACLHNDKVKQIVSQVKPEYEPGGLGWLLRKGEVLINEDQIEQANMTLAKAPDSAAEHPRLLALLARIQARSGNREQAQALFKRALNTLGNQDLSELKPIARNNLRLTLGDAAVDMNDWEAALKLARQSIDDATSEPLAYMLLVKSLVQRAEFQLQCSAVQASSHAPGSHSISREVRHEFEKAVQQASDLLPGEKEQPLLAYWRRRGQYVLAEAPESKAIQPQDAAECAALVSAFRRAGKMQAALKAAAAYPEQPQVLLESALTLAGDQPQQALTDALQAAQAMPDNPLLLAELAFLAAQQCEYQLALQSIQAALDLWQDEPGWHALAAEMYSKQGYPAAAMGAWENALILEPENHSFALNLAKACLENHIPEKALRTLNSMPSSMPLQAETCELMAKAYHQRGDYHKSISCIEKMIEINPDGASPYLIGAQIALEAGDPFQAEHYLNKGQEAYADDPALILMEAKVLGYKNRQRDAIKLLDKAIHLADEPLPLLLERAKLIDQVEGEEAGLNTLAALAQDHPDEAAVLTELSKALIQAGDYQQAINAATHALRMNDGKLPPWEKAELQHQIGVLLRQSGQLDQAIQYLDEAIQRAPGLLDAYLEIAEAYRQRRQHHIGLEYLKQAIVMAPNDPRPYREAGVLLKESKDYAAAENMLRRAASLAPKDIDIQRKLGAVIALSLVHHPFEIEVHA